LFGRQNQILWISKSRQNPVHRWTKSICFCRSNPQFFLVNFSEILFHSANCILLIFNSILMYPHKIQYMLIPV
jgi:hypothetical protein